MDTSREAFLRVSAHVSAHDVCLARRIQCESSLRSLCVTYEEGSKMFVQAN